MKRSRNETLKIRYQVYRRLGYDSRTSRALAQRSLDVSDLEISKKTGKLKRNTVTKQYINTTMEQYKRRDAIDNYRKRYQRIVNDTNYTQHGLVTHDKRYKGETGKIITIIRQENRLSHDQAYYFLYFMNRYGLSYTDTKKELLTNKEFEEYDKLKHQRQVTVLNERKQKKVERQINAWNIKKQSRK